MVCLERNGVQKIVKDGFFKSREAHQWARNHQHEFNQALTVWKIVGDYGHLLHPSLDSVLPKNKVLTVIGKR